MGRVANAACAVFLSAAGLLASPPASATAPRKLPGVLGNFDIKAEPAPADWRYFLKAPERERELLWSRQSQRGMKLGHWSWGWRLGWVRACGTSEQAYCGQILRTALFDRALVVRAEAATRLGRRYAGSGDADVVRLLAKAYALGRNVRRGQPLFVHMRILFALRDIGGDDALATGEKLAAAHEATAAYWEKLNSAISSL
jgi:hypothetical protein